MTPPDLDGIIPWFQNRQYLLELGYAKDRLFLRRVREEQIEAAIGDDAPVVIRDYPTYWSGARCLILGWIRDRPLHIHLRYEDPVPEVITVYWPDEQPDRWLDNWTRDVDWNGNGNANP